MSQPWRFVPTIAAAGATQMAIDEWLLDQLIQGQQPPTLRFYRWSPIALSLGYHQKQWPESWADLCWQGQPVELVRRPTGGRGVLHQGDLTYAIAMPLMGHRQEAYRQICDALIAAWKHLGVNLRYGTTGHTYRHQANCFALATPADLVTATGYKLIGSAQLRRDRYLLQHGSIRLWPNWQLYRQVFGAAAVPAVARPAAIPEHADEGFLASLEQLIQQQLARSLQIKFAPAPLSPAERAAVEPQASQFAIPASSWPAPVASAQEDIRPRL